MIDRFCTIESKFVNIRRINNVSRFIFVSNHRRPIKIENGDERYLMLKFSDDATGNFSYFTKLNNQFDKPLFYQQSFCYLKNEAELSRFNPRIMPITDIKNEIMNAYNESWLLLFEEKIERFIKGYEMKKVYRDYKKYC
jgi:hypothetical protein